MKNVLDDAILNNTSTLEVRNVYYFHLCSYNLKVANNNILYENCYLADL